MANNVLIKDATGATLTMKTTESGGIHTPSQRIDGYDPQDDMIKVKSVQKKFRDSFTGVAVDTTKWLFTPGTEAHSAVASGVLTWGNGTAANDTHSLTSLETFTVPFRVTFGMTLSQRIANSSFYVEAVSVNMTTGEPDGLHSCGFVFDGVTATQGKYFVQNGGGAPLVSAAVTLPTTASGSVYELEPFSDEVWFHGGLMDSNAARANSYRRHQQIPDPNATYKLRLRWLNGATSPASNTLATFQYVACQDYAELTAEITAGRGQTVAGQAIGVAVVSMPTTTVTGTVTANAASQDNVFYNDSVVAQAASATVTGTARDTGVAAAAVHRYSAFNACAFADQAGTLRIEMSNDNVTWRRSCADTAVVANAAVILSVPIMTRYYRAVYVNGATLQGAFMLNTSFTAA
jgi:hypothetical protein